MNEFALINHFFKKDNLKNTILGIGDDCAIIDIDKNHQLVTSTDTLIEGVHFDKSYSPEDIGYRALAVNLSDIAAMGAKPKWFSLALTLPKSDEVFLKKFSQGLFKLANLHNLELIGGDTTKGHLSITITIMGVLPQNQGLLRSGAKIDDDIYVSNTLGNAAFALQKSKDAQKFLKFLHQPQPQIKLGQALLNIANSCIDISDGLQADLTHILKASNVGASINIDLLPIEDLVKKQNNICLVLAGGDDYQLCWTANAKQKQNINKIAKTLGIKITNIGKITDKKHLDIIGLTEKCQPYQHFQ
jgi:thiamine-monophosphate kinase